MCGRFTVSYSYDDLKRMLSRDYDIFDFEIDYDLPRFNVAPGQEVISLISDGNNYRVGTFKWGFIPFFAKEESIGYKMINARSEAVSETKSFKESFYKKRCIILADGYYEWKTEGKQKTPNYITLSNKSIFAFAGIWSSFKKEDGTILYTCAILTSKSNQLLSGIHDRMPVILDEVQAKEWLNPRNKEEEDLKSLLQEYDASKMSFYQVSNYVNKVGNDSPICIKEEIITDLFSM